MMWERVKLADVSDSCLGKMLDQRKNKGIYKPYLANVNVRWGAFDLDNLQEMKFEDDEDERYGIKYGDLIICEGGEPGRCAIWKEQLPNMKIQKALHRLRVNEEMDYRYVYYWFLLAGKQGALKQYYTGATIMHMPGQKLKEVVIDKPPLDVQRKIGDYLEAFDDLIENNQKQIKLLEEAAQRLYKEWFVDLRFPGYEDVEIVDGVPEGWEITPINMVANLKAGGDKPKTFSEKMTNENKIPVFANGITGKGLMGFTDKAVINNPSVTISARGTVGVVFLRTEPYVPIVRLISVTPIEDKVDILYLYLYLINQNFRSTGAAQQQITVPLLKSKNIICPTDDVRKSFNDVITSIFNKIDILEKHINMFVCLNKVTCVRMYNYVQEYWAKEIEVLESKIKNASQQEAQELRRKLKWMQETEMAVVISQEQNEIQTFKEWHLDIKPHREKMEKRELDKEFKDSKNPLRIVFVCAMWLTGFDVKCLSCLYLDKPLKAHTLMQAIARANRVNEGKSNGLIIDYIGIVKALRKALADYTANVSGISGTDPTIDKKELISRITDTIGKAKIFLAEHDFDLESLIVAVGFAKLSYLQEAANAVCGTIENKKTYSTYASELNRLMKYIDRADITEHTRKQYEAIAAIYAELQKKRKHVNTTNLMIEINSIISSYIEIQHMPITSNQETRRFDISAIDFGLLRTEFAKVKRKNLVMRDLEEIIQQKLDRMLFTNPERINYYERYQQIIMGYNAEQDRATIEKTFMDLMDLANQMNQEEQRYAREGFSSDEELSLYDMLFRDDLSKNDIKKLKEVATTLLRKIKNRIAEIDHWTDKQETKAEIDNLIRNILYDELPLCYDEISISTYRQRIYEYVYTRYKSVA